MTRDLIIPVVGIATSASNADALGAFLAALPANAGAYFIVADVGPPGSPGLAEVISSVTERPVEQIGRATPLREGVVYVLPAGRRLHFSRDAVSALPLEETHQHVAAVDLFLHAVADQCPDGIVVILSDVGGELGSGISAVKQSGGIILAQTPNKPDDGVVVEAADFHLPVAELGRCAAELLSQQGRAGFDADAAEEEDYLKRILAHVRLKTGHDFSHYKRATLVRRIARRTQISRKSTLAAYYAYLRDSADEAQALLSDFLISVTSFFRDPQAFAVLAQLVIPQLFQGRGTAPIRVWVPGCASGEEAYSIGMLLLEEASRRDVRPQIQVFGSDLDAAALAIARDGRYPASIESDLSEERLRRFFQREDNHYRVRRELRDIVLFAHHSLLSDPPFSRLDMISCRNVLIYLDRSLQQQVYATFHYALNPGGYLFLGSSESADQPSGLFHPIDREARLYRAVAGHKRTELPVLFTSAEKAGRPAAGSRSVATAASADAAFHRKALERVAPPSMLVNEAHVALHLSDSAGRYLQPSGGTVTTDAVDLVRQELRFDLRAALHRAFEYNETTLSMPIAVKFDDGARRVYLQVRPVPPDDGVARHALVLFIEGETADNPPAPIEGLPGQRPAEEIIRQLQEELQLSHLRLRETREESEAANEELRAANEELQSINEEYRSTSEELETSKEELQSINEELHTVNNELKLKLETVSLAHSDIQNLMAATDIGTLFLDPSLRIKRFTPRLRDIFNVTPNDIGRPLTDFSHQLEYEELVEHIRAVLQKLEPIEREVQSRSSGWYLVRISPYRTIEDRNDGIVATFIDITERRRTEAALRESEARLRQEARLVELSRSPIFVWDVDSGIVQWNRGSEVLYGYTREEAAGKAKEKLLKTVVPGSSFEALRQTLLETGTWSGEVLHTTKDGRVLTVESQLELVKSGPRRLVLESTRDITDQKRWEKRQTFLLNELAHRVKNSLTVVQSLSRQTLRTSPSNKDFVERFEGRLSALANAHRLLVESQWESAELLELAHSQLDAHLGNDRTRLRIHGDVVLLPAELATPFGLVLHELATNAVKYGSLSVPGGRVDLSWETEGNAPSRLKVIWVESGGPPVKPASRQGLGGVLIDQGLPGAQVRRDFLPSGLVCTIEIELPELVEHGIRE